MRPSILIAGLALGFALVAPIRGAAAPAPNWQKPPGPIAGKWAAHCPGYAAEDLVIDFEVSGKKATGKVAHVQPAATRGYKVGEVIFNLAADDYGDWVGKLKFRTAAGAVHEDPIRLVATPDQVTATMTTDDCYRNMTRAGK